MGKGTYLRAAIALVLVAAGACNDGGDDHSGATGTGTSGSSSGGDSGPVSECEQAASADACATVTGCAWFEVLHISREGSTCTLLDVFSTCLPATDGGDGCMSPPSCEPAEDPFMQVQPDGTAWGVTVCGGPHPANWMHCESGAPNAEPDICACSCNLAV